MSIKISRRSFLKAGLAAAGTAAAGAAPLAGKAHAASGRQLCTLLDIRKCVGCEACVEACRWENEAKFPEPVDEMPVMKPVSRVKVADWSSPEKREIRDRLTPYNWLTIQTAEGEYNGESYFLNIPRRCMHCQNPPCTNLCPFGAAHQKGNGIVRIHPELCMGGAKCKKVCPWHIPERQSGVGLHLALMPQYAGNGVMYKCDRCYDRIADGTLPACIEACPEQVQTIGPRDEIVRQAYALADEIGGFVYGDKENGGTNTIYVSPVPFEELDRSIQKGPGRPHLARVGDAMENTNYLLGALAIAPVAAVLGTLGRSVSRAAKKEDRS